MRGFENSVASVEKGRSLGLGVLGYHLPTTKRYPFEGMERN